MYGASASAHSRIRAANYRGGGPQLPAPCRPTGSPGRGTRTRSRRRPVRLRTPLPQGRSRRRWRRRSVRREFVPVGADHHLAVLEQRARSSRVRGRTSAGGRPVAVPVATVSRRRRALVAQGLRRPCGQHPRHRRRTDVAPSPRRLLARRTVRRSAAGGACSRMRWAFVPLIAERRRCRRGAGDPARPATPSPRSAARTAPGRPVHVRRGRSTCRASSAARRAAAPAPS